MHFFLYAPSPRCLRIVRRHVMLREIMVKWQPVGSPSMAIRPDDKEVDPDGESANFLQIRRVNFRGKEGER